MEYINQYFSIDEITTSLEKIAMIFGLEFSEDIKDHRKKTMKKKGKEVTHRETWEVTKKGKLEYTLEFVSEDIHYFNERGRDTYRTRLTDTSGKVLLISTHEQVNTPDSFADDQEFEGEGNKYETCLMTSDSLATRLYEELITSVKKPKYPITTVA